MTESAASYELEGDMEDLRLTRDGAKGRKSGASSDKAIVLRFDYGGRVESRGQLLVEHDQEGSIEYDASNE
jgi:hypothetical protein